MKILHFLKYPAIILNIKNWSFLWNYWLGLESMVSHKYEKAIIHFNKCLNGKYPSNLIWSIYEQLGKCYFDINEIEKGKSFLLKSLEILSPGDNINSEVSSRLGFIFYQGGDFEKAKYYLQKAINDFKKIDYTNIKAVKEYLLKLK